jgi:fibronectin type 3 domain-containing protein
MRHRTGQKANRRSAGAKSRARVCRFEQFEPRYLLAANASPFPQITWSTLANGIPVLTSFPTAPAMIYLDYDGDAGQEIAETDFDNTPGVFTPYEQQRIHEHWRGITAVFSMFNVGVTTVQPAAGVPTQWIAITNDMITKGGFNGVNTFPDTEPSGQSGSDWWAEGYSHELSHGFGNWHQASYDELGNKLDEYAPFPMNDPLRAGIMGDGSGTIAKWQFGHSSLDAATIQQDMEAIRADLDALPGGGDGYRPDDQAGTSIATATALTVVDSTTQARIGIIERLTDQDWWSFTSAGGTYNILVGRDNPSPVDVKVSIYNSAGTLLATDDGDPITSATAGSSNYRTLVNDTHLSMNLAAGTYYIKVESHGNYADQGQYIARVDRMLDGWQSEDIGLVVSPGFTDYDPATGTFYVGGSGRGIGGTTAQGGDQAQYAFTKMTGNGEIIARVASLEVAQNVIRAGLMVRESLATGSKSFSVLATPVHGVKREYRAATNGSYTSNGTSNFNFSPVWLRIKRVGDLFTAYYSSNGTSWTQVSSAQSVTMGAEVYIGLVSTSANDLDRLTANFLTTATFTGVKVIQQADIGTVGVVGSTTYNPVTDTYTVQGNGAGWGNIANPNSPQDASYVYYQSLAGNGSITVRVASVSAVNVPSATSGIFIRESISQNSKYFAAWVKPNQGTVRSLRATTGSSSNEVVDLTSYWLRIERIGNVFRSYRSDDGAQWTQFGGDQIINMNAKVLIGLMVATGNTFTTNTTTFDNLSFSGGVNASVAQSDLPAPANVAISNVTSTSANISWTSPNLSVPGDFNQDGKVDAADYVLWRKNGGPPSDYDIWRSNLGKLPPTITGFTVERSIDNVNYQSIGTTAAGILTFTDNGLTGAQKYYYRVRTNDVFGSSAPSSVVTSTARPQAVTGLKVYSYSTNQHVVEWLDTSGESDYTLQRSLTGVDTDPWTTIGSTTISRNTTIYVNPTSGGSALSPGTRYFYRVITVDGSGNSATSNVVSAYTRSNDKPGNVRFASTSSTSINFSWDAVPNAVRYAVYRGRDNSTNEWQLLNSNVTTTTFTNTGLTNGKEYYYRIVGYDANGAPSQTATILGWPGLTTHPLPSPWLTQDIGNVGLSGAAGFSNGTFTVIGGGADIWGNSDEFRFVYAEMSGDGFIQARVADERNPAANYYSRAGLQIRNTLDVGSQQVSLMLHESDYPIHLQFRSTINGGTGEDDGPAIQANAPYWLRLERSGNTITGKASPDGVTWTTIASRTITMNSMVYVGMVVTPRDDNWAHWATFENVTSTPTGGGSGSLLEPGALLVDSLATTAADTPVVAFSPRNASRWQASTSAVEGRQAIDNALTLLDVRQQRHGRRTDAQDATLNDGPRENGDQSHIEQDIVVEIFSDPVGLFGRLTRATRT